MCAPQRQAVSVPQILFQLNFRQFSVRRGHPAHPDALVIHCIGIDHARVFAAQGITLHEAAPVKNLEQIFLFRFIRFFKPALFQAVQPFPVAGCHGGHVFRPFQPSLNLAGCNTRFLQFRQFVPQAHVPGAQPRAPAAAVIIFHPAGLGASAPVPAPFSHHAGKQAKSAHCHTLRAMDKHFNLNARIRALPDFLQGAFPCQHSPADSLPAAPDYPCPVVYGHLGACVHRQSREKPPGNPQHAQVLDQHRVCLQVIQQPQHLCHPAQFSVLHQRVHRHMNPHMAQMGKTDSVLQLLPVKVSRTGARTESGIPKVYRVRTCRIRPFQGRAVSRRSQVLHRRYAP